MIQRSANRSLLVVGSVALDDIDGPFGMHRDQLGGSASFIARAASYFTSKVSIVAVVGEDFSQQHLDELHERGVDVSGVERAEGETFHWVGKYAPDLATRETLDTRLGVFADFQPKLSAVHHGAEILPLPVGASISVCSPAPMRGQPRLCTRVGAAKLSVNHARVVAENEARGSTTGSAPASTAGGGDDVGLLARALTPAILNNLANPGRSGTRLTGRPVATLSILG